MTVVIVKQDERYDMLHHDQQQYQLECVDITCRFFCSISFPSIDQITILCQIRKKRLAILDVIGCVPDYSIL